MNHSHRSTRRTQGFTLTELLISMLLFAFLLLVIFATANSVLKLYRADQAQVKANRNGRGLLDTLGIDVRQAGENLTADFPAVQVTSGGAASSVLTLRRNLLTDPLVVCSPVQSNSTALYVNASSFILSPNYNGLYANGSLAPAGASTLQTACSTGAVDLSTWQAALAAGINTGYIYDVRANQGQFITITAANNNVLNFAFNSAPSSGLIFQPRTVNSSTTPPTVRVYLLEDHTYTLNTSTNTVTLSVNGGTAVAAAPGVSSFVVTPYINTSPPTAASLPYTSTPSAATPTTYGWRDLHHLNINMTIIGVQNNRAVSRVFSGNFVPRNVLSTDD